MVPVAVVEIVPVRVVEMVPVAVVEIVPTRVVEIVPVFERAVPVRAKVKINDNIDSLKFRIAVLLVFKRQGLGRLKNTLPWKASFLGRPFQNLRSVFLLSMHVPTAEGESRWTLSLTKGVL